MEIKTDVTKQAAIAAELKAQNASQIDNPILKRVAGKVQEESKPAPHQAYDRMHHRHNRT